MVILHNLPVITAASLWPGSLGKSVTSFSSIKGQYYIVNEVSWEMFKNQATIYSVPFYLNRSLWKHVEFVRGGYYKYL